MRLWLGSLSLIDSFGILLTVGFLCLGISSHSLARDELQLELQSVRMIWDQGPHNAFTDLTRFQEHFFCVFREASEHVSADGKIRVLSSGDGSTWEPRALIALDGYDLRDPKIVVHPDGNRMMINGGAAVREGGQPSTREHSFVSFSPNGKEWSTPKWVAEESEWLWRVTWFRGKAYGVAYDVRPESRSRATYGTRLLVSNTGETFSPLVSPLYRDGGPTEATLRFDKDGTGYCLQRRDGQLSNTAILGVSTPPYTDWTWTDLGQYLGGPNLIQAPSGHWIAAGRLIGEKGPRTALCSLDVAKGTLERLLTVPSGGDTSYPGLVWNEDTLWVSYYSSHEGRSCIYLASVTIAEP